MFVCPKCDKGTVIGTDQYDAKSVLCRAVIHSGQYDKIGDDYIMSSLQAIAIKVNTFNGSERNGINSENSENNGFA